MVAVIPAHPRSRGENYGVEIELAPGYGSSPLTRGKRTKNPNSRGHPRLIPAHAGKTFYALGQARPGAAHPRSRGENIVAALVGTGENGSSPLTRGKQELLLSPQVRGGLIPAHAGKT